jgi:cell wall-associated NlpC family hydrolase
LYVSAQNELKMKTKQADLAMKHLQIAQASVNSGKRAIGKLAANAYVTGGGFTDLDSLLKADGPQDLADRLNALDAVGQNNSTALDRFKSAEVVASSAQKAADVAKQAQATATIKVAAAKKAAEAAEAMQQEEVDKLQAVQDKLAKELAVAQKTRVTLEQQRQLALLEEANASRAALTPDQSKIWPDIGFTGRSSTRSTEAMRAAAVEYASKQVLAKKRYVWGSEGPTTFDCSGLVFASYRSAGLGFPNWDRLNSSLYWVATKRVSLSELVPGDLLFYSYKGTVSTIHHITIYAGDGMMWEANSKDKGLLYSSIYSVKGLMPYGGRV